MINYLCTVESQETIFKDQLLCNPSYFIFKRKWGVLSIYVDARDECQTRDEKYIIKKKKGKKKPERVVGDAS